MLNVRKTVLLYSQITTRGTIFGLFDGFSDNDGSLVCRDFSSKPRSRTHYYDVLGLTPSASQSQVKQAFYEKSKIHHPDVDKSGGGLAKFKEISEAYEILGNASSRRTYDEGIRHQQINRTGYKWDTDYQSDRNFRGQGFARRRPPPTGRSNMYDFDEFYKQHYGDTLKRNRQQEHYRQDMYKRMRQRDQDEGVLRTVSICFIVFGIVALLYTR